MGKEGWQPTFDAKSRNAKIQNSHFCRWVGGGRGVGGGMGRGGGWWPTFDAKSRNAKIQYSHFRRGEGGRGWGGVANFDAESRNARTRNSYFHRGSKLLFNGCHWLLIVFQPRQDQVQDFRLAYCSLIGQ